MKRNVTLVTLLVLAALLLAACGGTNEPALAGSSTERTTGSSLDTYYENALALRNQLALGTLRLEEADWPVTGGQASELLLLWQALRGTIGNGASAPAELDALQEQIERVMTTEQLAAIGAMRLTQADLQA
ncbi:MAG: hypothetical protein JXM73_19175 [Anaerolineae bacterium]|nr:hypothetical protein [Anaerolineae bacterium]